MRTRTAGSPLPTGADRRGRDHQARSADPTGGDDENGEKFSPRRRGGSGRRWGAQAADLPVKAKPVEYVKVCSLYGEGFFYIPGTDTCIKIGGWVRAEYAFATGNSDFPFITNPVTGRNTRDDSPDYNTRARFVFSTDTRTQTEYGTLRSYFRAGFQMTVQSTPPGNTLTLNGTLMGNTITGTWTLSGLMAGCTGNGNFTMNRS